MVRQRADRFQIYMLPLGAVMVDDRVVGDGIKPGDEWRVATLKAGQVFPCLKIDPGGQVFGNPVIADAEEDVAVNAVEGGFIELAECVGVSAAGSLDELLLDVLIDDRGRETDVNCYNLVRHGTVS